MFFSCVAIFLILTLEAKGRRVSALVGLCAFVAATRAFDAAGVLRAEDGSTTAAATKRFDPLRRDALGAQTRYPAVAKIVGRDEPQTKEDGSQTIPLYYGVGTLVAEVGEWGIVVSNWHVVNESRDSIVAKFPTFSSPARVILYDDYWDLAALVVRKPPRVAPIPISLVAPEVGDVLWVAGYGWSAGLTEFQIQAGRLINYAEIVSDGEDDANGKTGKNGKTGDGERDADAPAPTKRVLYETLAVDKGVRPGDSGGPIFNRYGELAGVLWGSNGRATMGTYGPRVQYFLTQAIERLALLEAERRLDAVEGDFLNWRLADGGAQKAEGADVRAQEAAKKLRVYPISSVPVYVAADGRETAENLARLEKNVAEERARTALIAAENAKPTALPPSPPVFSPTFVALQRELERVRPEVAETEVWAATSDWASQTTLARRAPRPANGVRETSAVAADSTLLAANGSPGSKGLLADGATIVAAKPIRSEPDAAAPDARPIAHWQPVSNDGARSADLADEEKPVDGVNSAELTDGEKPVDGANSAELTNEENLVDGENSADSAVGGKDAKRENRVNLNGVYFSDFQVYLIVCMIFCLFYNAARLMTAADEKKERRKRRKERADVAERRAG